MVHNNQRYNRINIRDKNIEWLCSNAKIVFPGGGVSGGCGDGGGGCCAGVDPVVVWVVGYG